MKKNLLFYCHLFLLGLLAACSAPAPENKQAETFSDASPRLKDEYLVRGTIAGFEGKHKLLFSDISGENIMPLFEVPIDEKGDFIFRAKIDAPLPFMLTLLDKNEEIFDPQNNLLLFLERAEIQITASATAFAKAQVVGSQSHQVFDAYRKSTQIEGLDIPSLTQEMMKAKEVGDSAKIVLLENQYEKYWQNYVRANKAFAQRYPESPVTAYVAATEMLDTMYVAELEQIVMKNNSIWVKSIKNYLNNKDRY
ncbi:DUF4369 domain-containing protein [Hugenholtzia roseola]|uniref:DUF4369 domain-containing protein n=1 Tax=Hugenholtzia roseola TaxID=1002 RepID=UPI000417DE60|nr:DUF4369 domain-containing protein [Hugenholtzia roseola]